MMNLKDDELSVLVQGIASQENPSINTYDITDSNDLIELKHLSEQHFHSVLLSVYSPRKTIVPEGVFDKKYLANYLNFNFGTEESNSHLKSDYVRQVDSNLVYSEDKKIDHLLNLFPETRVRHSISLLLEAHMRSSVASQSQQVTVYCEDNYMEIVASEGKNLLFTNGFQVSNAEDFTYYVVYVMDILGLGLKNTKVRLCGNCPEDGFDLLKKYCPMSNYQRFEYDLNIGKNLSDQDFSREAILLNQYQCA